MRKINREIVFTGSHEEILTGMEVTLYGEWAKISDYLDILSSEKVEKFKKLKSRDGLINVAENVSKIIATICVGSFLVWAIQYLNIN